MDKDFTEIGISVVSGKYDGRTTTVVVQHFGSRASVTQPSYNQSGENIASDQEVVQNATSDEPKEKPKKKPEPKKIKLPEVKNSKLEIDESNPEEIIWYTSPILFLIKTLS